ncbi:hypothetical protein MMC22_003681 [Lobaria immixta]|nr:hypothetical protein [Lobaria immixta]
MTTRTLMPPRTTIQSTMRAAHLKRKILYILVMGLSGVGKSTFISIVTENDTIPIGAASNLMGETQEVQDYILDYHHNGVLYEIHLIDSPGFDDGALIDTDVLSRIATYVNTNYKLKQRLAGVLYLHDITKTKVGWTGKRNLRMLENMIGTDAYRYCTLVTTKWGCTTISKDEETREKSLREERDFFGSMLYNNGMNADMKRFDPKTKKRALEIIIPYLDQKFTPQISHQMVAPDGPKLPLGETEAGKVVVDNLTKLKCTEDQLLKLERAQETLSQKYDEKLFEEFKQKRKVLRRKIHMQRSGRWIMRTSLISGAIVATVLTLGPGASVFALEPAFEKVASRQRKMEKEEKEKLKAKFVEESQKSNRFSQISPDWVLDKNMNRLQDVEDLYSLKSRSSDSDILKIAKRGEVVGFAASESSEAILGAADLAKFEGWELSYSDTDLSDSDYEKE